MGSQGSLCFSNYAITCFSHLQVQENIFHQRHRQVQRRGGGAQISTVPPQVFGTLGKTHYKHCSPLSTRVVLNELRDLDCIIEIANYAGLLSTRNLNFKLPVFREKPYNLFM